MPNKGISYKSAAYFLKMSLRGGRRRSNLQFCEKNKNCFTTLAMTRILRIALILLISNLALANKIIYVDDDANGVNDGSSWQNAYTFLQDALTDARNSEKPLEICVARGIYIPNQGRFPITSLFLGEASFSLINNVTIKGGYAGVNESDPNARNIKLYESILSGDLDGDDIKVNDPCDLLKGIRGINSLNVLYSNNNDANAVLDGFTISSGSCTVFVDPGPYGGAGMFINKGHPTITNCTFTGNIAPQYGGGIFINYGSPTLIGCYFTKNCASRGGAVYNGSAGFERRIGNPTFINCIFSNNYSTSDGAGISGGGNILMSNCTFRDNFSESLGGGLYTSGITDLENCIFTNNSAMTEGGGISTNKYNQLTTINNCIFTGNRVLGIQSSLGSGGACCLSGDNTKITNCTFHGNWAEQNSAIYKTSTSILNISNSILWNDVNGISQSDPNTLTVKYSDIQGGWEGEGNINSDPLFAMPGHWADANDPNIVAEPNEPNAVWIEGDYHLKSQAGRWDTNSKTWIQDDVTSPCIDAGDPNSPIGYEPFPNGGYINMGAYGGTSEASKSYFGKPVCDTIVAGDINGDCKVDILDLEILLLHWLEEY
jgi:hypothetical protein